MRGNGVSSRFALALLLLAGCEGNERAARAPGASSVPAAEVIAHTYLPRLERENYWEPVRRAAGEDKFLLQFHPRLKVPSEGPWTLTVKNAAGETAFERKDLKVDVATGAISLLCESSRFAPGDWTASLDLEEGGLTSGPAQHVFRFRVE